MAGGRTRNGWFRSGSAPLNSAAKGLASPHPVGRGGWWSRTRHGAQASIEQNRNHNRGGENGRHGRQSKRAPVHRPRRTLRQRQDVVAGSDPDADRGHQPAGTRRRQKYSGRLLRRSPRPPDERRGQYRRNRIHGRPLHLHRLPRLDRIPGPVRPRPRRRRSCGGRGGSRCEEAPGAAGHPARSRAAENPAPHVPQQDRSSRGQRRRCAGHAAARLGRAAGAAPAAAARRQRDHRLHRSGAGARPHLS